MVFPPRKIYVRHQKWSKMRLLAPGKVVLACHCLIGWSGDVLALGSLGWQAVGAAPCRCDGKASGKNENPGLWGKKY